VGLFLNRTKSESLPRHLRGDKQYEKRREERFSTLDLEIEKKTSIEGINWGYSPLSQRSLGGEKPYSNLSASKGKEIVKD